MANNMDYKYSLLTFILFLTLYTPTENAPNPNCLPQKTTKYYENDALERLDWSFCEVRTTKLGGMRNLKAVSLKGNFLINLSVQMLCNNTALETLDVSQNNLRNLEANVLKNLKNLRELDLSHNKLYEVQINVFNCDNSALVSINLSYNPFESFPKLNSTSVQYLNMSGCGISHIASDALTNLSALESLDLTNNQCDELTENLTSITLTTLYLSVRGNSTRSNIKFKDCPNLNNIELILKKDIPKEYVSTLPRWVYVLLVPVFILLLCVLIVIFSKKCCVDYDELQDRDQNNTM